MLKRLFISIMALLLTWLPLAATQGSLPTSVTILTRDDFLGRNFTTVAEALHELTPINIERDGYRGTKAVAKMRGVSSAGYVLVMIDGRPLTHEFDTGVDLSQIPITIAERIEITRSGTSASHGAEAIGGSINIITSRPDQLGLVTRLGTGVGRDGVKNMEGRIRARSWWGDWTFLSSSEKSSGYMFNEEMDTESHFGNITRTFNGKGHWGVEYYFQNSEVGQPNGTSLPMPLWQRKLEREPNTPLRQKREESQHLRIRLASPKIGEGRLLGHVTRSNRNVDSLESPQGVNLEDKDVQVTSYEVKWVRKGFEMGGQKEARRRQIYPYDERKTHNTAGFMLQKFEGKNWTALPSVRYDHHANFRGLTSPRLSLLYHPCDAFLVSGTATRGFRTPNFDELFLGTTTVLNTNIRPETAWTYDLGIRMGKPDRFQLGVTGYFSRIEDLFQESTTTSTGYLSQGYEENVGAETNIVAEVGKNTKYRHYRLDASWVYQRSRRNFHMGEGLILTRMTPRHLVLIRATQILPIRMTLTNEIQYQSEQFELDNDQGLKVPGHYVWNVRFRIRILTAHLHFDVENITQQLYADNIATYTPTGSSTQQTALAPQSARTFWAGISIRFVN